MTLNPLLWLCKHGHHCRRAKTVYVFNGGRGAWLCCRCRVIVKYGHTR